MVETDEQTHKCKAFFFERIPSLAYEAKDGTTKFKTRTKVTVCQGLCLLHLLHFVVRDCVCAGAYVLVAGTAPGKGLNTNY